MNAVERKTYYANCQNLLRMIGLLYQRGYTGIIPVPNIREGVGRWRLFLQSTPQNVIAVHQWFAELGLPDISYHQFEKTVCPYSIDQLAERFSLDHAVWLTQAKSNPVDTKFEVWYHAFLTTLKEGDVVYESASYNILNATPAWHVHNVNANTRQKHTRTVIPYNLACLQVSTK